MAKREWMETLIVGQADGAAHGNSAAAVSIIPTAAVYSIPANYFEIGKKLRIRIGGRISSIADAAGTLTLEVKFGATTVANGGAMLLNANAKTNVSWLAEFELTCRSIGSSTSATMMWMGTYLSENIKGGIAASAGGTGAYLLPSSAPAVGTGFDSTLANALDVKGTWSAADPANTLTVHTYEVVALN